MLHHILDVMKKFIGKKKLKKESFGYQSKILKHRLEKPLLIRRKIILKIMLMLIHRIHRPFSDLERKIKEIG